MADKSRAVGSVTYKEADEGSPAQTTRPLHTNPFQSASTQLPVTKMRPNCLGDRKALTLQKGYFGQG